MKEFAKEAKGYGLLYVPIRNKKKPESIEVVVFADDAAKSSAFTTTLAWITSRPRLAK